MIDIQKLKNAIELTQNCKFKEAEQIYLDLLKANPNESPLLSAVGLFYVQLQDYNSAIKYLKQACRIKETFGTVASLGFAEFERKNYNEAINIFQRALTLGENVDVYNKLVLSFFEIRDYKNAEVYAQKMKELYPNESRTIANLVKILTHSGKLLEAEKCCVDFLRNNPDDSLLWYHLGLLKELIYSDDKQAIECYKISKENGNKNADYNIAVAHQKLGNFDEAERYYKSYLKLNPESQDGLISLGMCYLTQRRFKDGYDLLYKRKKGNITSLTNNLWKPGKSLDKKLVIIGDQGFGDQIQFIRYLPFFKQHNITVAVSAGLKNLFKSNYPAIDFISYSEIDPEVQSIRLSDSAYVLNMDFDNIPHKNGYLDITAQDIQETKPKVGLCWEAGAAGVRDMINRTINVKCFEPLFSRSDIQLFSFQYEDSLNGNEKYPQMINLAKYFKDFSDTASALKSMDLVITVDTCIAHLAGALGLKTYLLLPYVSDWRWFRGGGKCYQGNGNNDTSTLWYNSVKIFKQENPLSWKEPICKILELL